MTDRHIDPARPGLARPTRTIHWSCGKVNAYTQGPSIYVEITCVDEPDPCRITPEFGRDLVGLCYALGMSEVEGQTESEDDVDYLMRQVATCLNFLET